MIRQAIAAIIFACLVVTAVSVGAVAFFGFGVGLTQAAILGCATLAALFGLQVFLMLNRRLADLEDDLMVAARRLTLLEDEMSSLSAHVDASDEGLRNQFQDQLGGTKADIATLTGIARKLAERTARVEHEILAAAQTPPQPAGPQAMQAPQDVQNASPFSARSAIPQSTNREEPSSSRTKPFENAAPKRLVKLGEEQRARRQTSSPEDRDYMQALMRNALRDDSLEVHLQPTMALPQRRADSYEMLVRFREPAGTLVTAGECLVFAKEAGLMADIDLKMAQRAVAIAHSLRQRKSSMPLHCNLSQDLLTDGKLFPHLFNLLEAHKDQATGLFFEVSQEDFADFGPIEQEALNALRELGFSFCLDFAIDRALDPKTLVAHGFSAVKMPVDILTSEEEIDGLDIHPEDLASLLGRNGVQLIATDLEVEQQVLDALDYGIRRAQGLLFAGPKPVRADLLQNSSDAQTSALRALSA